MCMRLSFSTRSSSGAARSSVVYSFLMNGISSFGSKSFACRGSASGMNVPWWTAGRNAFDHSGGPTVVGMIRAQYDEPGQVLILRAQPVGQPRAHRRTARLNVPGVHHQHRRLVVRDVGLHRADDADVIDDSERCGKISLTSMPRLAVLLERERRLHQRAGLALGRHRTARQRLAVVLRQRRLGVERVDLD